MKRFLELDLGKHLFASEIEIVLLELVSKDTPIPNI